jgi:hypothetical protein
MWRNLWIIVGMALWMVIPVTGQVPGSTQGEFWDHAIEAGANRNPPIEAKAEPPPAPRTVGRIPTRRITIRLFGFVFSWDVPLIFFSPPRKDGFSIPVPPVSQDQGKEWLFKDYPEAGKADDYNCDKESDYPDCKPDSSIPSGS